MVKKGQIYCNMWQHMANIYYLSTQNPYFYKETYIWRHTIPFVHDLQLFSSVLSKFYTLFSQKNTTTSSFKSREQLSLTMEWCFPDSKSILHYHKSIRTALAGLVSVLWPLTLPHTPLFRIIKILKFVKYIAIYGQIWTTIVIPGLEVIFCTGKHLLEEKECHRSLIMGIHDTISKHFVLWFHKMLPQYLDFTYTEHIIVLFEWCFLKDNSFWITTYQSVHIYLA